MNNNGLPNSYDAWKLSYPPAWDNESEPEDEDTETNENEEEVEIFITGLTRCLECYSVWDAEEESACEKCGSNLIVSI